MTLDILAVVEQYMLEGVVLALGTGLAVVDKLCRKEGSYAS